MNKRKLKVWNDYLDAHPAEDGSVKRRKGIIYIMTNGEWKRWNSSRDWGKTVIDDDAFWGNND